MRGKTRDSAMEKIGYGGKYTTPRKSLERLLSTDRDCCNNNSNSPMNPARDPYVEQLAFQVAIRKQKSAEITKKI